MDKRIAIVCLLCVVVKGVSSNVTDRLKKCGCSRRPHSSDQNGWQIIKREVENTAVMAVSNCVSPVAGYIGGRVIRYLLNGGNQVNRVSAVVSPGETGSTSEWEAVNLNSKSNGARNQRDAHPKKITNRRVTGSPTVNSYASSDASSSDTDSSRDSSDESDSSTEESDKSRDSDLSSGSLGSESDSETDSDESRCCSDCDGSDCSCSDSHDSDSESGDSDSGSEDSESESDDESGDGESEDHRPSMLIILEHKPFSPFGDSDSIEEMQFDTVDVYREDNSEELTETQQGAVNWNYYSGDSSWEELWSWEIDQVESILNMKTDGLMLAINLPGAKDTMDKLLARLPQLIC